MLTRACCILLLFVLIVGHCLGESPMFYIYDWPDHLQDVWPPLNYTLSPKSPFSHRFRGNNGAGSLLDPSLGYFATWQFSMFQQTMARLRASKYRTLDPSKATTFIIPYDFGTHSFIDHKDGHERVASPHGWEATQILTKEIAKNSVVWKNRGHDHFIFQSITSYQIIGIGSKVRYLFLAYTIAIPQTKLFDNFK
jgi:hypothetical protein